VVNEIIIRFKDRDLRFRFTQQVMAQWTVFASFTVMLEFATRHGAGVPQLDFKYVFTPIHLAFLALLITGYLPKYGAYCAPNPYPIIFFVQTAFFFSLYFGFRFMKRNNYFVTWRSYESVNGEDDNYNKQLESTIEKDFTVNGELMASSSQVSAYRKTLEVKQLKAQMVFIECFYDFLIVVYIVEVFISTLLMVLIPGGVVGCQADGSHWLFSDCTSLLLMYMSHTVATMQTASMCRNVFIKTINDLKKTDDFIDAERQDRELRSKLSSKVHMTPRVPGDIL
jgi:hypothetical protein